MLPIREVAMIQQMPQLQLPYQVMVLVPQEQQKFLVGKLPILL
jgi:hypothetical protein